MRLAAAAESVDFFRWVPHPEVWLLVGGLIGLGSVPGECEGGV